MRDNWYESKYSERWFTSQCYPAGDNFENPRFSTDALALRPALLRDKTTVFP